jgi:hypothetical protein
MSSYIFYLLERTESEIKVVGLSTIIFLGLDFIPIFCFLFYLRGAWWCVSWCYLPQRPVCYLLFFVIYSDGNTVGVFDVDLVAFGVCDRERLKPDIAIWKGLAAPALRDAGCA